MAQQADDSACLWHCRFDSQPLELWQLWHRLQMQLGFNPWSGNLHSCRYNHKMRKKKKKKKTLFWSSCCGSVG